MRRRGHRYLGMRGGGEWRGGGCLRGRGGWASRRVGGRRLVEGVGVSAGDAVLDVATGRGAVLFPAAERVGPGGSVVGIDLAVGMVERTRAEIERRGVANASVRQMDAERLDFADGSFD